MKDYIICVIGYIFYFIFDNKIFIKEKRGTGTLLSNNIVWFTTCSWLDQLIAFKQLEEYKTNKL
jgi:hypothetical protein